MANNAIPLILLIDAEKLDLQHAQSCSIDRYVAKKRKKNHIVIVTRPFTKSTRCVSLNVRVVYVSIFRLFM